MNIMQNKHIQPNQNHYQNVINKQATTETTTIPLTNSIIVRQNKKESTSQQINKQSQNDNP